MHRGITISESVAWRPQYVDDPTHRRVFATLASRPDRSTWQRRVARYGPPRCKLETIFLWGFPELVASNWDKPSRKNRPTWMNPGNWQRTLQALGKRTAERPRMWWTPKGKDPYVRQTDSIRVSICEGESRRYAAGDVVAAIAHFVPTTGDQVWRVTPHYRNLARRQ